MTPQPLPDGSAAPATTATTAADHARRPYLAYRDSGVPWLGAIPAHWEVKRLKAIADYVARGDAPEYVDDSSVRVISQACIQWDGLHPEHAKFQLETDVTSWDSRLRANDLLINATGTGTLGRVVVFHEQGTYIADGHVTIVRAKPLDADSNFLRYLLTATLYQGYIYSALVSGSTNQIELSREGLRATPFILPPLAEQRAIAAYLDCETARLDALVAAKQRLIALLREKRAALISQAVTRGLRAGVALRQSGVPWLGQIPAHWQVKRIKFAARLATGHTPSRQHPEYWEDCTIPWISLADVWQLRDGRTEYINDTSEYISKLGLDNSSAVLLPAGTVILSRTASVGFSGIMSRAMATTQDFVNWVCGPTLRPEYLLYVFRSMEQELRRLTMGSTHQTIYMPDVGQFMTPLPPLDEQDEILRYIREHAERLDTLSDKLSSQIEQLREYRSAVIAAAVTGQFDVR